MWAFRGAIGEIDILSENFLGIENLIRIGLIKLLWESLMSRPASIKVDNLDLNQLEKRNDKCKRHYHYECLAAVEEFIVNQNCLNIPMNELLKCIKNISIVITELNCHYHRANEWENERSLLHKKIRKEEIVIIYTDAVVDPRTVVIVSLYALLANNTMSTAATSNDLTIRAKAGRLEYLK